MELEELHKKIVKLQKLYPYDNRVYGFLVLIRQILSNKEKLERRVKKFLKIYGDV